ncbi:hypothetical protein RJ641_017857 [Dillenia turbinata]|uniref:Uncharacterized protein n=1 Tax=Dillenia turbinata TaxID=194707 RepID=A0AAN8USB4_9MAGN
MSVRNDEIELLRASEIADAGVSDIGGLVRRYYVIPYTHLLLRQLSFSLREMGLDLPTSQLYAGIENENNILRAQVMELNDRLELPNSILGIIEEVKGYSFDIPQMVDLCSSRGSFTTHLNLSWLLQTSTQCINGRFVGCTTQRGAQVQDTNRRHRRVAYELDTSGIPMHGCTREDLHAKLTRMINKSSYRWLLVARICCRSKKVATTYDNRAWRGVKPMAVKVGAVE